MDKIKPLDLFLVDELFERQNDKGYVLDFSDRTFADFFAQELHVDIFDPALSVTGGKLKRLRAFLLASDTPLVVRTLRALWDYREALRARFQNAEHVPNAHARLLDLIQRLEGGVATPPPKPPPLRHDALKIAGLLQRLNELHPMNPQQRGYAFEIFLKDLFGAYGLESREPFRLRGEQIDGSFQLDGETYLVEAKWQNAPSGVGELHTFHGKVEQKAAWARGLFVSYAGFTEEGLDAFGRGKRVICMNGYDLYETLNRGLSLHDALAMKVRRAAETGLAYIPVRDLFPA
jgi:hypothetical protein